MKINNNNNVVRAFEKLTKVPVSEIISDPIHSHNKKMMYFFLHREYMLSFQEIAELCGELRLETVISAITEVTILSTSHHKSTIQHLSELLKNENENEN